MMKHGEQSILRETGIYAAQLPQTSIFEGTVIAG
jgi:hypothetical protein